MSDEPDEEYEEPAVTVLEFGRAWPLAELPQSARTLVKEVLADGWEAIAQRSLARHAEVLYKKASKADAKKKHNVGEVWIPEKDVEHFGVQGMLGEAARFWATWDRPVGGKPKFVGAYIWDAVSGNYYETVAGGFKEWRMLFRRPEDRPAPAAAKPEVPELVSEFTMEEAA